MSVSRKRYSSDFKAKISLEALQGNSTINEIATRNKIHPNQIVLWKKQAMVGLADVFNQRKSRSQKDGEEREASLYQEIGKLKMELEWLKKKSGVFRS